MRSGCAAQVRAIVVSVSGGASHNDSVSESGSTTYYTRGGRGDGAGKQLEQEFCPFMMVDSGVTCERCRLATAQEQGNKAVPARTSSVRGKGTT